MAGRDIARPDTLVVSDVFGPTWQQIGNTSAKSVDWGANTAQRLVPKTAADWGVIGLIASFAFLLLGFWVSLTRPAPAAQPPHDTAATPDA